ncbi:MAG TPA: SdpI family protein [Ferruginibacter sp.]|nr:SdpI family protein [Ferruginibacter sp.]HNA01005.1 SdpI family protein [Ferruginibacter sp.]HNA16279.1 SdpI family protein [Ferruginibacter sp.]HNF01383.1 SdpI family protein [Ferruginibacter sp.]HNJ93245.1 SdpI family protein [Ferruginibacter sp.]
MKQSKTTGLIPLLFLLIPWLYLAFIWGDLPDRIPTHFGITGAPDAFGNRNEIVIAPAIMTITGILLFVLLRNIHKIDPKKKYTEATVSAMAKIATAVLLLLSAVTIFILYWTTQGKIAGFTALFCLLGLFFTYLGNLMHSVKPNYFVGFRTPWTLENEQNWRKTHQLASKVWFTGGILLTVLSFLLPVKILLVVFVGILLIMTLIPLVYSYRMYRSMSK